MRCARPDQAAEWAACHVKNHGTAMALRHLRTCTWREKLQFARLEMAERTRRQVLYCTARHCSLDRKRPAKVLCLLQLKRASGASQYSPARRTLASLHSFIHSFIHSHGLVDERVSYSSTFTSAFSEKMTRTVIFSRAVLTLRRIRVLKNAARADCKCRSQEHRRQPIITQSCYARLDWLDIYRCKVIATHIILSLKKVA